MKKGFLFGLLGSSTLLALYFLIVSLVSNYPFAVEQFSKYWPYLISLALGFGIQVGLFVYLKNEIKKHASKSVLAVSGSTSTAAMVSCCTHYLANFIPILGAAGIVTFVSQYQIELFWVGLGFNFLGILYILTKLRKFQKAR